MKNELNIQQNYLTIDQAAEAVGRSVATLRRYRSESRSTGKLLGPLSLMIGGRVLYRRADLQAWIDAEIERSVEIAR